MKMNKDGLRINWKVFLAMSLFALFLLPAFSYAALVGNNIPIASYEYDQQNPDVVYLPDLDVWFVVWEDWRTYFGTKAAIYGQFIDQNGNPCGDEFPITPTTEAGSQTMPRVAYRMYPPSGDAIMVVWQDTTHSPADNPTSGYASYTTFGTCSVSPTTNVTPLLCSNASGTWTSVVPSVTFLPSYTCTFTPPVSLPNAGTQIGFNPTYQWQVSSSQSPSGMQQAGIGFGNGASPQVTPYTGSVEAPVVPGTVTVTAGSQSVNDNGAGILQWDGSGTIDYSTGLVSVFFSGVVSSSTPIVVSWEYEVTTYTPTSVSMNDTLSSRTSPRIGYDPVRDFFWVAWTEKRSTLNSVSEDCFGEQAVNWTFGDNTFPGYVELDGGSNSTDHIIGEPLTNAIGVNGPDIIRNIMGNFKKGQPTRTNRRVSMTSSASGSTYTETFEYEFFTDLNNITLASDSTSAATFLAWEGVHQKALLTCTCVNTDGSTSGCDATGVITSTLQISDYEDGNVHIYSIFDSNIPEGVVYSMKLDSALAPPLAGAAAHNPSLGFDPITERFLASWEDMRYNPSDSPAFNYKASYNDSDGENTKVWGQIVQSNGGLYSSDFIISYSDLAVPGVQDSNVANSIQSSPYVSYDPVNERFFVAWQDGRNGSVSLQNLDIYGQKVDAEGTMEGDNYAIVTQPSNQLRPAIAYNSATDQFLCVWKDARNADNSSCSDEYTYFPAAPVPVPPSYYYWGLYGPNAYNANGTPYPTNSNGYPCGADVFGQIFTLANPALTLLNPNNSPLAPPLLNNFQNPAGSGIVQVGLSATQSFLVMNTGDATLNISNIYSGLLNCSSPSTWLNIPPPFTFNGLPSQLETPGCLCNSSCNEYVSLVPGATLELTVQFTPLAGGSYNDSFTISSNGGNATVSLSALATEADISVTPSTYTFPGQVFIGNSATETFVVKNIGVANLLISSLTPPSSPFSIQSDGCTGQTVAAGSTCNIVVQFTPTVPPPPATLPYTFAGQFTINSNAVNVPQFTVNLTGTGQGAPSINVSPTTISFGNVQVNQTSPAQTITISNTGTQTLNISSITGPTAPFAMTNGCGASLAVGAPPCQLTVTVKPTIAGSVGGTITITSNDPVKGAGVVVSLSAVGVTTPQISVNPAYVNFPSTPEGTTVTQNITVTSAGSANLQITGITNPTPDFSITNSTCIGSFIPEATCTITVSFDPSKTGIQTSSFTISSNDPVTPIFTVNLSGTGSSSSGGSGLPPGVQAIQASPMSFNFGNVREGTHSAPETFTIKNTSSVGNLVIGTIQYPGTPYSVTSDTCTGSTLAPSKTCTLTVTFNPTRVLYYYPYYIVINSDDPIEPKLKITLGGNGTAK